ncbi:MAG TPA: flagellar biosynthesis protein FlhA [Firmicutes bacterium]|nr:flagellar biosynthesis protein FlhA [Bacillota bacterium]
MAQNISRRSYLSRIGGSGELIAVGIIIIILGMFFIPLPSFILDFFLSINISLSFLILLLTMNVRKTLEFSVFPSLLLVTTLLRLALNVSSTRLILLHGYAGQVIQAFGDFVAGSNPVVGFVIFIILTIINFMVITKGSERVAEVAARFTLDAMPGKQMSIDADLNAGLINEEQARARRREIEREADFYGAMDGASKFVKGDAIAGIIITIINLLGGLAIGILQRGQDLAGAAQTYALLTVGDGLVSQVPALLISTATGILVTRSASEDDLGSDLSRQLTFYPKIIALGSGVIALFGLVRGMPTIPFLMVAIVLAVLSRYLIRKEEKMAEVETEEKAATAELETQRPENVLTLLTVDPMELEIGYSLIPLVDKSQGGDLFERVSLIRRQVALELGIILPPIRIRDNMQLSPGQYLIKIKGVDVAQGELLTNYYLAMDAGAVTEEIDGIPTREPAFGLPAIWITEKQREKAELNGYTVVDAPSVLVTHLTEIIRNYAHELLGRQETQTMLDHIKEDYPVVVEELIPNLMSVGEVQKVLAQLLKEGIPIRNLVSILETLADYAPMTKDTGLLTEYVRATLARQITKLLVGEENILYVLTVAPKIEQRIQQAQNEGQPLEPAWINQFDQSLSKEVKKVMENGYNPVIMVSPAIRRFTKSLVERLYPKIPVVSFQEITSETDVHSLGMVGAGD